jgi:hypothetical protein
LKKKDEKKTEPVSLEFLLYISLYHLLTACVYLRLSVALWTFVKLVIIFLSLNETDGFISSEWILSMKKASRGHDQKATGPKYEIKSIPWKCKLMDPFFKNLKPIEARQVKLNVWRAKSYKKNGHVQSSIARGIP